MPAKSMFFKGDFPIFGRELCNADAQTELPSAIECPADADITLLPVAFSNSVLLCEMKMPNGPFSLSIVLNWIEERVSEIEPPGSAQTG